MKKIILGIMIGIILCAGIVHVVSYYVKDMTYNSTYSSSNVNNVSEALYNLYQGNNNHQLVELGL